MSNSTVQLGDTLQTTCQHCGAVFRITSSHLDQARGQVRCGECLQVFNALLSLENYSQDQDRQITRSRYSRYPLSRKEQKSVQREEALVDRPTLSLQQAMYGENYRSMGQFKPLLWMVGILLLVAAAVVQVVYYQRYSLISSPHYQEQIIGLCQLLPCDQSRFVDLEHIRLLERNIFTHPTRKKALMVTGSFVNEAPFSQPFPRLLISLSDTQGQFIANRLFEAKEYLSDTAQARLDPGKVVQFQVEIVDPGNKALTYEFEFFE